MLTATYDPQHTALRPFPGYAVGDLIQIDDPQRAQLMIRQHLVAPITPPPVAVFHPSHVVLRPYPGHTPGDIVQIEDRERARLMVKQGLVRTATDEEIAAEAPAPTGAGINLASIGIRNLPGYLAEVTDTAVLRGWLATETRTNARPLIEKRLAQLED